MARQTFRSAAPATSGHEATLEGNYVDSRRHGDGELESWSLDVTFRPMIPFADVNAIMGSFTTVNGQLMANGLDIQGFLLDASTDECRDQLEALLRDRDRAVDIVTLGQLAVWLIGLYSGRVQDQGNPTTL